MQVAKSMFFGAVFGSIFGIFCAGRNYRDNIARGLPIPTRYLWRDHVACEALGQFQKEVGRTPDFLKLVGGMDKLMRELFEGHSDGNVYEHETELTNLLHSGSTELQAKIKGIIHDLCLAIENKKGSAFE